MVRLGRCRAAKQPSGHLVGHPCRRLPRSRQGMRLSQFEMAGEHADETLRDARQTPQLGADQAQLGLNPRREGPHSKTRERGRAHQHKRIYNRDPGAALSERAGGFAIPHLDVDLASAAMLGKRYLDLAAEHRIAAEGNERQTRELERRNYLPGGERMILGQHAHHRRSNQRFNSNGRQAERIDGDPDVGRPALDHLDHLLQLIDLDDHLDLGGWPREGRHDRGQDRVAYSRGCNHGQRAASVRLDLLHHALGIGEGCEDILSLSEQQLCFFGRDEAPLCAVEEIEPEHVLEMTDRIADSRLGSPQEVGGAHGRPGPHHGIEHFEVPEVHAPEDSKDTLAHYRMRAAHWQGNRWAAGS